ncbi:MAG: hypothetical protein LBU83_09475 [Bacteroidales bacterium]|jgi:hypothetical protein|nr:hypothetical protein [Bacteroidales bacterium]
MEKTFIKFGLFLALGLGILTFNSCKVYDGTQIKGDVIGFSDNIQKSYKKNTPPYNLVSGTRSQRVQHPFDQNEMRKYIDGLELGTNTALYYAVDNGLDRVKNVRKKYMNNSKNSKYFLITFTDGLDNISNHLGKVKGNEEKWQEKYAKKNGRKMKKAVGNKGNQFQSYVLCLYGGDLQQSWPDSTDVIKQLKPFTGSSKNAICPEVILSQSVDGLAEEFQKQFTSRSFAFQIPKGNVGQQVKMLMISKEERDQIELIGTFKKGGGNKYYLLDIKAVNKTSPNKKVVFLNDKGLEYKKGKLKMSEFSHKNDDKVLFELIGFKNANRPLSVMKDSDTQEILQRGSFRVNSEYKSYPTSVQDAYILPIIDCSKSLLIEENDPYFLKNPECKDPENMVPRDGKIYYNCVVKSAKEMMRQVINVIVVDE